MNREKWLERAKRTSARIESASETVSTPAFIRVEWPPKLDIPPPPLGPLKELQDAIRGMSQASRRISMNEASRRMNMDDIVFDSYADMTNKLFVMPRSFGKTTLARTKLAMANRNMENLLFGVEPTKPDFALKTIKFDPEHLKQLKEEQEKRLAMEEELARPARQAIGFGEW